MKTLSLYADKIEALKQKFGPSLVIMGHHYQQDEIMRHVDLAGDSLQLAQMMDGIDAEHIVFAVCISWRNPQSFWRNRNRRSICPIWALPASWLKWCRHKLWMLS